MRAKVHIYSRPQPVKHGATVKADCDMDVVNAVALYAGECEGVDRTAITCSKCKKLTDEPTEEREYQALIVSGEELKEEEV